MDKKLFGQQQTLFEEAVAAIQEGHHYILIKGPSGCGKTFLSNRLCTWITGEFYTEANAKSMLFLGDNRCSQREYYPILSELNHLNEYHELTKTLMTGIAKTATFAPFGGSFFEFVASAILNRNGSANHKLNQVFNENEIDIILKFRNALRQQVKVVYLDNLHWWDTKSIEFLYLLLQKKDEFLPELNNIIFIINVTTNQKTYQKEQLISFLESLPLVQLTFTPFQYPEYCRALQEIGLITPEYDAKVLKLLFAISETILDKGIMPSEKVLDFPVDCNTLTGSVNL